MTTPTTVAPAAATPNAPRDRDGQATAEPDRLRRFSPDTAWARRLRASIRTRILVSYVLVLTGATIASVLLVRQALLVRLDDRIDDQLVQESRELSRLAGGEDPETGATFGSDVRRIFEVFFERNVPARNEAFLSFVDGEPYLRSRNVLPYRLDRDPAIVKRWATATQTDAGSVETPGGTVRYLTVPVRSGGEVLGVFAAAVFRDLEAKEIDPAVRAAALVGVAALVIGSLLAARLARRIIAPVQSVQEAAQSISETDLSQRLEVMGDDEIAQLAETFNGLLDRLERAFLAQRQFVDDAGHELRTPITIVRGHLEVLDDDPAERRRTVELVTDELDRMNRMVNDLLLLAKTHQPNFLVFDLVEMALLTEELARKTSALGDRRWKLDAKAAGTIEADRQRLSQAVIQLAQNAVEHTDARDTIAIGTEIEGGRARLWVRDSGTGIPRAVQERIFERFSRSGPRLSDGAGLGLAIVRAIAEAHGGTISVQSHVGQGATFTIEIPVDRPLDEGA